MRNLSLWRSNHSSLRPPLGFDSPPQDHSISTVAVGPDQDAIYIASESRRGAANADIEIWRVGSIAVENSQATARLAVFSPTAIVSNPWSGTPTQATDSAPEVTSLRLLPDSRTLVLITHTGDIATLQVDDVEPQFDVVGSVDAGILAAEWGPDDSLLVLVTGDDKLILMSAMFDLLCEGPLHPPEFGEDAPITLGWGAKHTQFHGSLGKSAAHAGLDVSTVGMSPDDDHKPRISWRGDGAFFVVSTVLPPLGENTCQRRILRIYSREGTLSSTAEPIAGLEHTLSWRPSGNLMVGTQRFGSVDGLAKGREGRHDVVFFERNGLRHGEFSLRETEARLNGPFDSEIGLVGRWGYRVKEVGWSADSNVLSVWIEGEEGDVVQLWTIGNYHWYLKQEIPAPSTSSGEHGRFTSIRWHPEDPLKIILTTSSEVFQRTYAWEIYSSAASPPKDTGSVAVSDGASILLTAFRSQNVPPPMSSCALTLSTLPGLSLSSGMRRLPAPIHASFSPMRDLLAILWESGHVELVDLRTRIGPGCGKVMDPTHLWGGILVNKDMGAVARPSRQVFIWRARNEVAPTEGQDEVVHLAVLTSYLSEDGPDGIYMATVQGGTAVDKVEIAMPDRNGRLINAEEGVVWQSPSGDLFYVDLEAQSPSPVASFPEFCFTAMQVLVPDMGALSKDQASSSVLFIGLTNNGKLSVVTEGGTARGLASNATSFTVASGFLIFTSTAHVAQFAPLRELVPLCRPSSDDSGAASLPEWEKRRVERGSRIVTAVPSTMSLVLQMPRGNLETVNPRPLVMEIVRQDIDQHRYGKAFLACRKHRIDLNVIVDHNRDAFKIHLESFVEQVDDVDYINLFLTSLGQGSLPTDLIGELCDGIRAVLEKRDMKKYISSILTADVVKRPPDHEAALSLLLRLRDSEPQLVEDAVKYIIFLVDADRLFDTALGMYDFSLVLMIAQHAQKDPREYLPFLRELRALDHFYQRFRIDDHLKRHSKALRNLSRAGSERFDEAMQYVEKHKLYEDALAIWRDTDRYQDVLSVYGEWLFERREFKEAAFVFRQSGRNEKAMIAYEKSLDWQDLFELALQEKISKEGISELAYRVAEDLSSKKRYSDAARVLLDYAHDTKEAIKALVEGSYFSDARRILVLSSRPELLEEIIYPGILDCRAQITEDLNEMKDQLRKQVQRIRELRIKKTEEPDAFYGVEDIDLHNVDVMTDVSMAPTAFTRYTQAPSSVSRTSSKRSSRSKRKLERKVGSGRKGTVDEEEYLLKSVTKLVGRFNTTQADAANIIPHLLQFTEEHRAEGRALQDELSEFECALRAALDEVWTKASGAEGETEDSWAARMQEYEKQRHVDPLEKVAKPEVGKQEWKLRLPASN
ncbi:IkappaB kinase complex IKAP component [Laetiporus sulphureus 93-53]|uniref:Elongator complex protein 1 n=1 Tax=Laetiporus sulphureus 93-53 TaxID=1314785 RepID=A0A165DR19_9APHY|nr:IkappaB kinase complex IKAP component [Laetiporus sulphureus 93-53]KZT05444.1 IkappaB kinase complex IKAP component [Laetiporus sulphureus 93-53]